MNFTAPSRFLLVHIVLACAAPLAVAQSEASPSAAARPIEFATVAEARAALEARDGNGTIVTHPEGWVVVNEPMASAQWTFTLPGHAAHPAVLKRVIRRSADGAVSVETMPLCEAPKLACEQLVAEFAAMNDRITQAVRARGRQGSAQQ